MVGMDKVKIEEILKWGFECPDCGHWNELDDDPFSYSEHVICEDCGNDFKIDQ